jgi:hypothetical protein
MLKGDVQGQAADIQVDGTIEGDSIKGTITVSGLGGFPFTGSRPK